MSDSSRPGAPGSSDPSTRSAAAISPPAPTALAGIGQLSIAVGDVERARDFYRDVLSLVHLFDAPPGMSFFDCGGVRLLLARPEGPGKGDGTSILYFRVADIRAAHERLAGNGVAFERAPERVHRTPEHELWLAFFRDSEGNLLALMSEVPVTTSG